ncbi:hypothetical protein ABBQ38_014368 [Trebouxia sp. C0009 RCD-2024]
MQWGHDACWGWRCQLQYLLMVDHPGKSSSKMWEYQVTSMEGPKAADPGGTAATASQDLGMLEATSKAYRTKLLQSSPGRFVGVYVVVLHQM